jgi:hypothetical protein
VRAGAKVDVCFDQRESCRDKQTNEAMQEPLAMQMIAAAAADIYLCLIIAAPNAITSVFRLGAKNHGTFKRALGSSQMRGPVCEYAKPKRRCNQRSVCRSRSTPARGQLKFHSHSSQLRWRSHT